VKPTTPITLLSIENAYTISINDSTLLNDLKTQTKSQSDTIAIQNFKQNMAESV
jgi:hypothetical protein